MDEVSKSISKMMEKKYGSSYYQGTAPELTRVRSGLAGLDRLLGGGFPCGRMIEIFSDPSGGKTTSSLFFVKEFLEQGYNVAYQDLERTLDYDYIQKIGINSDNFHYSRPDTGQQAMEQLRDLILAGVKLIVVDSVPFLATDAAYEAEPGKQVMSPQAVLLSRSQQIIVPALEQNDAIVVFINQTRSKIGGYGNPITSSGGQALKFMCSVRLYLTRAGTATDGSGFTIKFKTEKNKVGLEKRSTEVDLKYESGLDRYSSLRESLIQLKLVTNRGSYFYFAEEFAKELGLSATKIGQGKSCIENLILQYPDLYNTLYEKVLNFKED